MSPMHAPEELTDTDRRTIAAALADRGYTDPALIAAMAGYASVDELEAAA